MMLLIIGSPQQSTDNSHHWVVDFVDQGLG
jgi:hypothetical protein